MPSMRVLSALPALLLGITGCTSGDEVAIRTDEVPETTVAECPVAEDAAPPGAAPLLDYELAVRSIDDLKRTSTLVAIVQPVDGSDSELGRSTDDPDEGYNTLVWFGQDAKVLEVSAGKIAVGDTIELVRSSFETTVTLIEDGETRTLQVKAPACRALPVESGYVQPYDGEAYLIGLVKVEEPSLSNSAWQPAVGPASVVRLEEGNDGEFYIVGPDAAPYRSALESKYSGQSVSKMFASAD